MSESRAAIQKLHSDLIELGVNGAYELGDDATLCVWISLVVVYRDGYFRWWEGASRCRHPGDDPRGCAVRVARRHAGLIKEVPPWWEDQNEVLRGEAVDDHP
ncbi:hypothetical protein [Herbidospora sp. RD11066]